MIQTNTTPIKVGFIYFHGLGDNILTFDALYAIKTIYQCKLIVFGNALFANLLKYCDFVDEVVDIKNDIQSHLSLINSYNLDYAILPKCKTSYLKALNQSNIHTIIAPIKIPSLLSRKCKTPSLLSFLKYRKMSMKERSLYVAREINPKLFDSQFPKLNPPTIQTSKQHKQTIVHFLSHHQIHKSHKLILINPFSITAAHSLSLKAFLQLMSKVSNIPQCIPLVITYPKVHTQFMQGLQNFQVGGGAINSLLIYENNSDVLNLIELISYTHCVISPSTGIIHIASHLSIPTIGLYGIGDLPEWATKDQRYVFIQSPKDQISPKEEELIIDKTLEVLHTINQ